MKTGEIMRKDQLSDIPAMLRDDRDRQMYRELDTFLCISKKYSAKSLTFIRIFSFTGGILVSALSFYFIRFSENKTLLTGIIIFSLLLGFSMLFYGNKPFPGCERIKKMISEDGITRIYNDMLTARRIKGSSIHLGNEYVFDRSGAIYRRNDVADVLIEEINMSGGTKSYWAVFHISDSIGSMNVYIKTLSSLNVEKRLKDFMYIKEVFEK